MITQLMVSIQTTIYRDERRYERIIEGKDRPDYRVIQRIKRHLTMLILIWPGNGPEEVDNLRRYFM